MNFIINLINFPNLGYVLTNQASLFVFDLHKISRPPGRLTSPMGQLLYRSQNKNLSTYSAEGLCFVEKQGLEPWFPP